MKNLLIKPIDPSLASKICKSITSTLPEWFAIPAVNERYEKGMLTRISFAAIYEEDYLGMITIDQPYSTNAHIYWMAVKKNYHGQKIGKKLLQAVEDYCLEHHLSTLTVETLSPKQNDTNYLKTFYFYQNNGFEPLFEMSPYETEHLMVYMQKRISLDDFVFVDLTHSLSADVPHWGIDVGFKYNARDIESADTTSNIKFHVQRLEMAAGIGTHMDAPSHCYGNSVSINEIPIQSLITTCRVIDVSHEAHEHYTMPADTILNFEANYGKIPKGSLVIIYTGWSKRWHQPDMYRNEKIFPSISVPAGELLLSKDIAGLGIDTLSPDVYGSDFPIHQLMLGAGKYMIENVANADKLDPTGSFVFALPIKVMDGTEAPMRLIGMKRRRPAV